MDFNITNVFARDDINNGRCDLIDEARNCQDASNDGA